MNVFLTLAFLFFIGSIGGWCLEVVFRRFFGSGRSQHKWVNPGFCTGPYLPIYGLGLCVLYLIASLESVRLIEHPVWSKVCLFLAMAVCMTLLEYIGGVILLKYFHVRLWDYRGLWGNIQGLICPLFSLIWACLGAVYYFLIHPHILEAVQWLSQDLAFSFVIGVFFGVFTIDLCRSLQLMNRLKEFADKYQLVLRFENIKETIREHQGTSGRKHTFFRPFRSDRPLSEYLKEMRASFESRSKKKKT